MSVIDRWSKPCEIVEYLCDRITPQVKPLVCEILEHEVEIVRSALIQKSPSASQKTHGHRDSDYWSINKSESYDLTTWIALEDVNTSNGALKVFPFARYLPHLPNVDFLAKDFIDPADNYESEVKTLNMSAGDIVLFSPHLLHASHESKKGLRTVLVVRWKRKKTVSDNCEFGMRNAEKCLIEVLEKLVVKSGLNPPENVGELKLIELVKSNKLTNKLPDSSLADDILEKFRILKLASEHHGDNLDGNIWKKVRDYIVKP